jgi:hypothetical protein
MTYPSGVLNNSTPQKKKKRGKIRKIDATFVSAISQGQRTHSARTNIFYFIATPLKMQK